MKKRNVFSLLLCALLCALPFAGCGETPSNPSQTLPEEPVQTPTFVPHSSAAGIPNCLAAEEDKRYFSDGNPEGFYWADGYSNGSQFDCTWRKSSAVIKDGVMRMTVSGEKNGYAGAEYRTDSRSGYGFYAVSMKAAKCSGVISSFFTYTNDPVWDEIDIEFLGKDTEKVQFNYYTKGKGGHEFLFDLGFDASESFHEYAFAFSPDEIVWYVDGIAVYRAEEELPSHPMQLMMNVWNCRNADSWSGVFDPSRLPVSAEYEWFSYPSAVGSAHG